MEELVNVEDVQRVQESLKPRNDDWEKDAQSYAEGFSDGYMQGMFSNKKRMDEKKVTKADQTSYLINEGVNFSFDSVSLLEKVKRKVRLFFNNSYKVECVGKTKEGTKIHLSRDIIEGLKLRNSSNNAK